MAGFFSKIFGGDKARYEAQKKKLISADGDARATLAAAADTHPEILYYLAKDADAAVRKSVAVNRASPVHAAALLAHDADDDVRFALAARLVELLPGLSPERHGQLYAYAVQALGALAEDGVLRVRAALSNALKDSAFAPPQVASKLARDVERAVSEPILRFCAALPDADLLDILASHPEPWVVSAVASRPRVSERVSEAVIETRDAPGAGVLVGNAGADISALTLEKIIENARDHPEWHAPIAARKELSAELARQLAGIASESVLRLLENRAGFDAATRREVALMVGRRVAWSGGGEETPEKRLERYVAAGTLSAEVIGDALSWQDARFVALALGHLARVHPVIAEKMLKSGSARPVIALCHRAGMPMRLAVELQKRYARLQPREMIYARGGTDYPLTAEEIRWQLEFYGVEV